MAYVLRDGIFQVKCRQTGCPFKSEFPIRQTITGETSTDCETEATRIAQNMAVIKHDAIYGRTHTLKDPVVRRVSGTYVPFGSSARSTGSAASAERLEEAELPHPLGAAGVRRYAKGEVILRKGDRATTVCEVIEGLACPDHSNSIRYEAGASFGAAGLLTNQARTGNVIAGREGTVIAFYHIQELSKVNPAKARELYNEVMEDTLHVIGYLDNRVVELQRQIEKLRGKSPGAKSVGRAKAARAAPAGRKRKKA